jgi:hypothetical protein
VSWTGTNVVTETKLDESSTRAPVTVRVPDRPDHLDQWDRWGPQGRPALEAPPDQPDHKARQDQGARLVLRVRPVPRARQARLELSDQQDLLDPPAWPDRQDLPDLMARLDQLDRKVRPDPPDL